MAVTEVVSAAQHIYLSTACLHGNHDYCKQCTRPDGTTKEPGQCKFCAAKCVCDCHV